LPPPMPVRRDPAFSSLLFRSCGRVSFVRSNTRYPVVMATANQASLSSFVSVGSADRP